MIKLIKYTAPSHYDLWPKGTLWQDGDNLYIQVSDDLAEATWLTMGKFLEGAFKNKLHDDLFIQVCLERYKDPETILS